MNEAGDPAKFSSILAEIRALADQSLVLSETRRLEERALSDEAIQLSEKRRLTERADANQALDVAEDAYVLSEKRRKTERDHSDQAVILGEKRLTTERSQAAKAFTLNKEQDTLEISLAHQEIGRLNQRIIQIIESMHETCLFFYDYRLIYINSQARTLYWPTENIIGKTLDELLPKDISEVFLKDYQNDQTPPPLIRFESEKFRANKCFQFFFYPSESGFLVCFNDITATKQNGKNKTTAP